MSCRVWMKSLFRWSFYEPFSSIIERGPAIKYPAVFWLARCSEKAWACTKSRFMPCKLRKFLANLQRPFDSLWNGGNFTFLRKTIPEMMMWKSMKTIQRPKNKVRHIIFDFSYHEIFAWSEVREKSTILRPKELFCLVQGSMKIIKIKGFFNSVAFFVDFLAWQWPFSELTKNSQQQIS